MITLLVMPTRTSGLPRSFATSAGLAFLFCAYILASLFVLFAKSGNTAGTTTSSTNRQGQSGVPFSAAFVAVSSQWREWNGDSVSLSRP
jgi:hypothetical protein